MEIGIIGLPNVGKSTLFSALTKKAVDISNYPFTTIDPNVGVVAVPDNRLEKIASVSKSQKIVSAIVEFVDIAGLVRGANKGEGLGNQFLTHIREVDAIVEVVRAFENQEIVHIEGAPDPVRDHEIIETELILKDLETVEKRIEYMEKEAKSGAGESVKALWALRNMRDALVSGKPLRGFRFDEEVVRQGKILGLLTAKSLLVVFNTHEMAAIDAVVNVFRKKDIAVCAMNVKEELDLSALNDDERNEFSGEAPALDRLIVEAYALLDLMSFLTTGEKKTRAWTIRRGTKAPQAAGVIHSDFEKKFIRAEAIYWEKFIEAGGWAQARAKGWVRSEGKEYVMQEGDVIDVKHG